MSPKKIVRAVRSFFAKRFTKKPARKNFKAVARYNPMMGWLTILPEDVHAVTIPSKNQHIDFLVRDGRIVGVKIYGFKGLLSESLKEGPHALTEIPPG